MSNAVLSPKLPSAMEQKLRSIRRRHAMLATLRAIAIGASVLVGAMLIAMVTDWWLTLFDTTVRTTLTTTSLIAGVVTLVVTAVRPLIEALQTTHAASKADDEIPQLEERWTAVASFAESGQQPETPTARAMLQQVTSEAVAMGRLVRPGQVARPASLRPAAKILGISLLVLAAFLAINWPQTSVLLQRFWSPTADITATGLTSVTGDQQVPRGEDVQLAAALTGVPRQTATLEVATGDELFDIYELKLGEADVSRTGTPARPGTENDSQGRAGVPVLRNAFAYSITADQSFCYRILAGDARTDWHRIEVIDYPVLSEAQLTVTAPEYVDRPKYEKTLIPSRIRVIEGSRLELRMKPDAPLESLELTLNFVGRDEDETGRNARPTVLTLQSDEDGWYRFETQLLEDMSLSPILVNAHGLHNEDKHVCRVQVIPDKAPVARIINPNSEMAVAFDEVIDIEWEAHDDLGISSAELVIEMESEDGEEPTVLSVQEIDLGDQLLEKHVRGTAQLDLKELGVEEGSSISYSIRVTDNRTLNLDAKAMRPQSTDAQPGESESDADAQMADAEIEDGDATAAGDASAADQAERMLPDAGKIPEGSSRIRENSDAETKTEYDRSLTTSATDETTSGESSAPESTDQETPPEGDTEKSKTGTPARPETSENPDDPGLSEVPKPKPATDEPGEGGPQDQGEDGNDPEQDGRGEGSAESDTSRDSTKPTDSQPGEEANGNPDDNDQPERDADSARQMLAMLRAEAGIGGAGKRSQQDRDNDPDASSSASMRRSPQQSDSGQNAQTRRRRLKVTARLSAVAAADGRKQVRMEIRDQVVHIDRMLQQVESALIRVVEREIPDADRSEQFRRLDTQLGEVEQFIANLREETRDGQFAFVGLQMVDIGRTHVTPARDRVFVGIREPLGARHATAALQHVDRARELLAALQKRYDRVSRDKELAEALEESVKMYEIYVERTHTLMREARRGGGGNPLKRKMAVIEVDQDYLDRYAEVVTLRREMMAEFARILGDDPRLMSRYLDLIRRRGNSVRRQLSDLADRQDEISVELSSWLQIDDDQRDDLWMIVAEMRLHATGPLAKDAADYAARVEKQMPLVLEADRGTAALVIEQARKLSELTRTTTFDVKRWMREGLTEETTPPLDESAEQLVFEISELEAALEQLSFENDDDESVTTYTTARLLENRTVADQADVWTQSVKDILAKRYNGLAEVDQQAVALATELLRIDMLGFEDDIEGQFQQANVGDVPGEIVDMIRELHFTMEGITFNQTAATFGMTQDNLVLAETQQSKALDGFGRAKRLFDRIRSAVAKELDRGETQNPDIENLRDPTLDEFLARLEREPNIEAQLGIPNRPRNLRVIADTMSWQTRGGAMLGDAENAARRRARNSMQRQQRGGSRQKPPRDEETPGGEMTEEERKERERERQMQEMLEKSLASIQEKINDPETSEKQRRQLQQMEKNMQRMADQGNRQRSASEDWERIVEAEKAKEVLRKLAAGERLEDSQWNKLLSTLDDGLWQVRGRTPPEDYQKAIEQYQDRLRELMDTVGSGAE